VRICLPFCTQDDQCGAGGRCFASVKCGERSTSSRRCAPACDPRGEATTGCAPGLRCFLLENDVTDCECASDAGEGRDGAKCTTSANCAPGFFCVDQKGDRACRALCRMAEPTCPAGYSCNELRDPGSKLFGTCEPI
jgi:hypothetical protein